MTGFTDPVIRTLTLLMGVIETRVMGILALSMGVQTQGMGTQTVVMGHV